MTEEKLLVPALFLHIQKTAGTSIVMAASQQYGNSMTSHGDCWGHQPHEFMKTGFVSGHIGYDFAKSLFSERFSFTFLRDPRERILSMYSFCRGRDSNEFMIYERANKLDLEGFLAAGLTDEWVKKNIWNNQVWQLAHGYAHLDDRSVNDFSEQELLGLAIEHLGKFSYIGFTESAEADSANIFEHLKISISAPLPRVNVTEQKLMLEDASPVELALLEELTVLDRQLYTYARSEYRKEMRR